MKAMITSLPRFQRSLRLDGLDTYGRRRPVNSGEESPAGFIRKRSRTGIPCARALGAKIIWLRAGCCTELARCQRSVDIGFVRHSQYGHREVAEPLNVLV